MKIIILIIEMAPELPFIPGAAAPRTLPLGRYLPPMPQGMISGWLQEHLSRGDWLLDPLGSTPALALEAARHGYRVLVASNNPILTFLTETLAQAPSEGEFVAALAELSAARRGEERLETHFRNLYLSECAACHQPLQPTALLWKRGENQPFARLYRCPNCGDEGEHPVTSVDIERLNLPGNPHLHLARALERVVLPGDPLRENVQEIAQFFLQRSLYFLTTLINRIEGLDLPEARRRLLIALALSACDDANSLWPYPEGRSRPRQLTVPPVFREKNLWLGLETAIQHWVDEAEPVKVTRWPVLPPETGGICLFPGRLRALLPLPPQMTPRAVVTVIPRPNQAFWTLSAVWSGWLWGREAVGPLRNALERQRYDWHWHANALQSVFSQLAQGLPGETPFWTVIPELVPGFLTAVMLAADSAHFRLKGQALLAEEELAQLDWSCEEGARSAPSNKSRETILKEAILAQLRLADEPSPYLTLHAAGLAGLAAAQALPERQRNIASETLTQMQNSFTRIFNGPAIIRCEPQPSQNIETGLWWLPDEEVKGGIPLADRVEIEMVRWLNKNPGKMPVEIYGALCQALPGLLTPSRELMKACLESYASLQNQPPAWQIRPSEAPAVRRSDLETIRRGLERLGQKLGYQVTGDTPVQWVSDGKPAYLLFPMASGVISRYIYETWPAPPQRCILVVPGSRINLILYKQRRDPRLAKATSGGWRLMKFRQLRQMLDQANLDAGLFEDLLDGDPPRWEEATQLSML